MYGIRSHRGDGQTGGKKEKVGGVGKDPLADRSLF
jgi:hypothetical protein